MIFRYVSWVPATAGIGSQEATSISVKACVDHRHLKPQLAASQVVRHASWTPARMPCARKQGETFDISECRTPHASALSCMAVPAILRGVRSNVLGTWREYVDVLILHP